MGIPGSMGFSDRWVSHHDSSQFVVAFSQFRHCDILTWGGGGLLSYGADYYNK